MPPTGACSDMCCSHRELRDILPLMAEGTQYVLASRRHLSVRPRVATLPSICIVVAAPLAGFSRVGALEVLASCQRTDMRTAKHRPTDPPRKLSMRIFLIAN